MLPATLVSHCPLALDYCPRPTHALRRCYVCFLFDFYPLNLERIVVACSFGFPLPASSRLLPARPTLSLRCSMSFKTLVVGAHIAVLEVTTLKQIVSAPPPVAGGPPEGPPAPTVLIRADRSRPSRALANRFGQNGSTETPAALGSRRTWRHFHFHFHLT